MTKRETPELRHQPATWESGIAGMTFHVRAVTQLDLPFVLQAMNRAFGKRSWAIVRGPDSMALR